MLMSTQGKIAEYRFVSEFIKRGYEVFIPAAEGTQTDLLICKDGIFQRVQIKCTLTADGETFKIKCHTNNTRGRRVYTVDDFDYLGVLDLVNDSGYLLPVEIIAGKDKIRMRLTPPKNNQIKKITYASNFKFF